ncbi:LPXTG cell wall anchor domain-containing protein [Lactobacillus rodentium]|uniref:Gram-positive cocci surface proteins LPxTG domain-containing protein n=1 Tax=Lactobacillus rodentium TaxID=947835 RepID=A0A2Z6TCG5_9LACO|nr:LPXTG cell wall anchor domain-containing protein [Lactobacillus rodentium]MCR1894129.1 LPXTG cell wall anchor domain-containing protein [Lactobacillus rodentium]GBG04425.1 hypothetical protein LrDSM24759_03390 [Lactobacillus rodentium]
MSIKKNSICKIALSAALVLGGTSLISTHTSSTVHADGPDGSNFGFISDDEEGYSKLFGGSSSESKTSDTASSTNDSSNQTTTQTNDSSDTTESTQSSDNSANEVISDSENTTAAASNEAATTNASADNSAVASTKSATPNATTTATDSTTMTELPQTGAKATTGILAGLGSLLSLVGLFGIRKKLN